MNGNYIPNEISKFHHFLSFLHVIFLILFVYFTLLTLNYKSPPSKAFFMSQTIKNAFQNQNQNASIPSNQILTKNLVINDLLERLKPITSDGNYLKNLLPISELKVSFVKFFIISVQS
jgi:hypothetical protein